MPLVASFVRTRGRRDRIYVRRSDGSELSWAFPTYGDQLPHDLVHLVVEAAFGVRRGLWGRVDAGVDPRRVNDEANRAGGKDKYAGFGADREELLLAEALAAAPWSDPERSDAEVRAALPIAASEERVREVRRALDALRARWRGFAEKGAIELAFDPSDPQASFERLGG